MERQSGCESTQLSARLNQLSRNEQIVLQSVLRVYNFVYWRLPGFSLVNDHTLLPDVNKPATLLLQYAHFH